SAARAGRRCGAGAGSWTAARSRTSPALSRLAQKPGQEATGGVHAVLGLPPDAAAVAVDDVGGGLLAPVGGQAVEEHAGGSQARDDTGVDGPALEVPPALLGLLLLTHRGPDVGADHVGALDGLLGPVVDGGLAAGGPDAVEVDRPEPVARRA